MVWAASCANRTGGLAKSYEGCVVLEIQLALRPRRTRRSLLADE